MNWLGGGAPLRAQQDLQIDLNSLFSMRNYKNTVYYVNIRDVEHLK